VEGDDAGDGVKKEKNVWLMEMLSKERTSVIFPAQMA
jgi:hypothetical protein